MIMSDWGGTYSTAECMKAGLDLEMPFVQVNIWIQLRIFTNIFSCSGPSVVRGKAIERAMTAGKLFVSDLDERVRKVSQLLHR